jgi:hypothetical protein
MDFFAKCLGGGSRGEPLFLPSPLPFGSGHRKKGASVVKPFWSPPFGRASASAHGEAAAKALPKGP